MSDKKETKTYILTFIDGKQKSITIPATWFVTYGPLVPNMKAIPSYGTKRFNAFLRIYESKEKQRAIYTDVIKFRDTSIIEEDKPSVKYDNEREHAARAGERRPPLGMDELRNIYHGTQSVSHQTTV